MMAKQYFGQRKERGTHIWFRHWAFILCTAVCLAVGVGTTVHATEGGGGHYPNGAEDFMSGAVPPPGTYFINYFDYYSANKLADNNGNALFPGFKLNVTADVFRFIHITDKKIFGERQQSRSRRHYRRPFYPLLA
jgi:hypothetical protein